MNEATYEKASEEANGEGKDVSTDATRTRREAMSPISEVRAGRSNTSRRYSR